LNKAKVPPSRKTTLPGVSRHDAVVEPGILQRIRDEEGADEGDGSLAEAKSASSETGNSSRDTSRAIPPPKKRAEPLATGQFSDLSAGDLQEPRGLKEMKFKQMASSSASSVQKDSGSSREGGGEGRLDRGKGTVSQRRRRKRRRHLPQESVEMPDRGSSEQEEPAFTGGAGLYGWVPVLVLILAGWLFFALRGEPSGDDVVGEKNLENLELLGFALNLYATKFDGKYPESIRELTAINTSAAQPGWIDSSSGRELEFVYFSGHRLGEHRSTIVAAAPAPDEDGNRAVLFLDTKVRKMPEDYFQRRIEEGSIY